MFKHATPLVRGIHARWTSARRGLYNILAPYAAGLPNYINNNIHLTYDRLSAYIMGYNSM